MKLRYSEAFYSVQGEGRWVGVPSLFLRVFGCNFECAGFGQERGKLIPVEEMPYNTDERADPKHELAYTSIEELPVTPVGCDSSASWSKKYKHLQMTKTPEEVFEHLVSLLPDGTFEGRHGEDIHLVITGGEPLLGWQRVWPSLLSMCKEIGLKNVTFETNGTQKLKEPFKQWIKDTPEEIFFSVSPKLFTVSGEKTEKAIKPENVAEYQECSSRGQLKFVVGSADREWDEMENTVQKFRDAGVNWPVWIMPTGAREEEQTETAGKVAEEAFKRGYNVSARVHVYLFGNAIGT